MFKSNVRTCLIRRRRKHHDDKVDDFKMQVPRLIIVSEMDLPLPETTRWDLLLYH